MSISGRWLWPVEKFNLLQLIPLFLLWPLGRSIPGGCVWSAGRDGAKLTLRQPAADGTGVTTGILPQPTAEVVPP